MKPKGIIMNDSNNAHSCARCGAPLETEPSQYKWDVFCINCFDEFKDRMRELDERDEMENLSEHQLRCELREIGWEFHIDPESARAFLWEIEG